MRNRVYAWNADCCVKLHYRHMKREGNITFNGQPATKRLKRHIGFVLQVCTHACKSITKTKYFIRSKALACGRMTLLDMFSALVHHRYGACILGTFV